MSDSKAGDREGGHPWRKPGQAALEKAQKDKKA
jgi:hypothetical protein